MLSQRRQTAVLFHFAEIVREHLIESQFLAKSSALWPWLQNYSHRDEHKTYHTLVNCFKLTLMVCQKSMHCGYMHMYICNFTV